MQNTNTNTNTLTKSEVNSLLEMAIRFVEAGGYTLNEVYAEVAKHLNTTTNEAAKAVAAHYEATR